MIFTNTMQKHRSLSQTMRGTRTHWSWSKTICGYMRRSELISIMKTNLFRQSYSKTR